MPKKTLNLQILDFEQLAESRPGISLMPCPCGAAAPRRPSRRSPFFGGPGFSPGPSIGIVMGGDMVCGDEDGGEDSPGEDGPTPGTGMGGR